ncbi:hypothetical protein JCM10213_005795 [Rhodosporidiobolus nylandii]
MAVEGPTSSSGRPDEVGRGSGRVSMPAEASSSSAQGRADSIEWPEAPGGGFAAETAETSGSSPAREKGKGRANGTNQAESRTVAEGTFSPLGREHPTAVSPSSLHAALADVASSSSSPTAGSSTAAPTASALRLVSSTDFPTNSSLASTETPARAPIPSPPAHLNGHGSSRFSTLKGRFISSPSPKAQNVELGEGPPARPNPHRRFSRSLPSLTPGSTDRQAPQSAGDTVAEESADKQPRWQSRSREKLRQLFKPPSVASKPSKASASLQLEMQLTVHTDSEPPLRPPSRSRASSAPLYIAHPPRLDPTKPALSHSPEQILSPSLTASAYCTAAASPTQAVFPATEPLSADEPEPDRFARLPRELQLAVLRGLMETCEEEWAREIKEGTWKSGKARELWGDGRARGRRELVKIGRVSKLWRSLSLDGQLWSTAPASSLLGADLVSPDVILSLMQRAGPFVRTLDARGLGKTLDWRTLEQVVEAAKSFRLTGTTGLTRIDLTGCTSLTSAALAALISSSPQLRDLTLIGLRMVNSSHTVALGASCPHLAHLNVSRCPNLPAQALFSLPYPPKRPASSSSTAPLPYRFVGLKSLRAAALENMDDNVLVELLERHPALETLDVSFSSRLTDAGIRGAVVTERASPRMRDGAELARTTSRGRARRPSQLTFPPSNSPSPSSLPLSILAERALPLRHLNLSACTSITSHGLAHLGGSLPSLEILELSRVGASLGTEGLVKLLSSTPRLRMLDLEGAEGAGDDVLLVLAAHAPYLTHLLVSSCTSLTDVAFAAVVERCQELRVLEADATAIAERTAKSFVELAKGRAAKAREAATAKWGDENPLVHVEYPAVLSLLDNRLTARRLSRDVASATSRPRTGQRGHWTSAVGFYHDDDELGAEAAATGNADAAKKRGALEECDETRVVVRSFYSSLAVDAASALRASREEKAKKGEGRVGLLRTRAMSDSEVLRRAGGSDERRGCVVS